MNARRSALQERDGHRQAKPRRYGAKEDLSDIDPLRDASDVLERPVSGSRWEIPDVVKLDGRSLCWEAQYFWGYPEQTPHFARETGPRTGMLQGFVTLGDAPPEQILSYAERWGVLHTRRVVRPARDQSPLRRWSVPEKVWVTLYNHVSKLHDDWEAAWRGGCFRGREPLCTWRFWAKKFRAALKLALDLRSTSGRTVRLGNYDRHLPTDPARRSDE